MTTDQKKTSSNPAQAKRRLYWLTDKVTDLHRARGMQLNERNYEVQFVSSFESLKSEISRQRVGIIVVGDEGAPELIERAMTSLILMPEIQGVNLVLSLSNFNEKLMRNAACSAFRDLIPLDLDEKQWLRRFVYATGRSPIDLPKPILSLSMREQLRLMVPARLIWVGSERLLFEAKIRPMRGTKLTLNGGFVKALGLPGIDLTCQEHRHTDLVYRFSDAIIANWEVPEHAREQSFLLLNKMRQTDFGPRCKVFLAVQDSDLRNEFAKNLDPLRFELNIVLQKQGIVTEPKYFSPQIVFFEDRLCLDDNFERFGEMLENLQPEVPVFIIGNRVQLKNVQGFDSSRKIGVLPRVPERLSETILAKLLPATSRKSLHADDDATYLTPDHPYSIAEISTPATLNRFHPMAVQITAPMMLGRYGLARIDGPFLRDYVGDPTFIKITDAFNDPNTPDQGTKYIAEACISDLNTENQVKLYQSLARFLLKQFKSSAQNLKVVSSEAPKADTLMAGFDAGQSRKEQNARRVVAKTMQQEALQEEVAEKTQSEEVYEYFTYAVANAEKSGEEFLRKAKSFALNPQVKAILIFTISAFLVFSLLWQVIQHVEEPAEDIGKASQEALKRMAPHRFKK